MSAGVKAKDRERHERIAKAKAYKRAVEAAERRAAEEARGLQARLKQEYLERQARRAA